MWVRTLPDAGLSSGDTEVRPLQGQCQPWGLCWAALLISAGVLHMSGVTGLMGATRAARPSSMCVSPPGSPEA